MFEIVNEFQITLTPLAMNMREVMEFVKYAAGVTLTCAMYENEYQWFRLEFWLYIWLLLSS